jgi:hypothetical protein
MRCVKWKENDALAFIGVFFLKNILVVLALGISNSLTNQYFFFESHNTGAMAGSIILKALGQVRK